MTNKDCKKRIISNVMREYKKKILKTHDRTVRSRKQALAIALSMANRRC